ncbi:hypothetical protein [Clostridium akagii]|uniref:hypothetical protein n=1 Tax=Clostridium akagii TaxID=91623 RepID=UPI00047BA078|nr:hypothetical protein [Clostridium akagii]
MDRREFNLENIKYWSKKPFEMLKGQSQIPTEEKVPNWTFLIMYVYCIIIFTAYLFICRFINTGQIGAKKESPIIIILIILFFAVMTYAFGGVIVATLIRIGVINTDKKTILNKTKNTIIITAILIASMSLFLGQMLLVRIFVVLAIVISIMFLIIENILEKK